MSAENRDSQLSITGSDASTFVEMFLANNRLSKLQPLSDMKPETAAARTLTIAEKQKTLIKMIQGYLPEEHPTVKVLIEQNGPYAYFLQFAVNRDTQEARLTVQGLPIAGQEPVNFHLIHSPLGNTTYSQMNQGSPLEHETLLIFPDRHPEEWYSFNEYGQYAKGIVVPAANLWMDTTPQNVYYVDHGHNTAIVASPIVSRDFSRVNIAFDNLLQLVKTPTTQPRITYPKAA